VVSFTPRPLYTSRKSLPYSLDRRSDRLRIRIIIIIIIIIIITTTTTTTIIIIISLFVKLFYM